MEIDLPNPEAQHTFGMRLAMQLPPQCVLYLEGDLGTGKTVLARGILQQLGHSGTVRSPTYTLLEPYAVADGMVYHLDLYRLISPDELEYLGLRDLLAEPARWLIEWPTRGAHHLPAPDVTIQLAHCANGRHLSVRGHTLLGCAVAAGVRGTIP